ncbi:MAG TPA: IclR family transcriptional regulator [Pseudolabrys sp.]|nr:IclR family transcriptional regulator [Pseudolabrys sp.]
MPAASRAKRQSRGHAAAAPKVQGAAAFGKFIAVLQIIADKPRELGVAELCKFAKLPRATVYRIVEGLRAEGLVQTVQPAKKLALGPRLINLASRSWATFDLRALAHDEIAALRDVTGETVHLAVPGGPEMVYVDKLESPQTVRMTSRIGTRISLYASSVGKAYLAALPAQERHDLLGKISFQRMTPHTITQRQALEAELAKTLKRGYALDMEETELEIRCIGAAIRNAAGRPIAGISVSVPKYRFDRNVETRYPAIVVECARRIAAQVAAAESPFPQ